MFIQGRARIGRRTKELVQRLKPREVAVIDHEDLDEVAAASLLARRVKAVINARRSFSGEFPHRGPLLLLQAGVPILDNVGGTFLEQVRDGQLLTLKDGEIYLDRQLAGRGTVLESSWLKEEFTSCNERFREKVKDFVRNTLNYAEREIDSLLGELQWPDLPVKLRGRQALVVVRGRGYREDLQTIRLYIKEERPVLIAVDGGADALLAAGYRPDLIVGDMDSISDQALRCGAFLLVHGYPSGAVPGLPRLEKLGLTCEVVKAPGTSEDLALLLAYEQGAELVVALGTHSGVIDFLEKGRHGMASTLLVRIKVGSILVDARGVARLYRQRVRPAWIVGLISVALWLFVTVALVLPGTTQLLRLLLIRVRMALAL